MYEKSCEISKNVYRIIVPCILKISNINVHVYCVPIIQQISDNRYMYFRQCKTNIHEMNCIKKCLLIWVHVENCLKGSELLPSNYQ